MALIQGINKSSNVFSLPANLSPLNLWSWLAYDVSTYKAKYHCLVSLFLSVVAPQLFASSPDIE